MRKLFFVLVAFVCLSAQGQQLEERYFNHLSLGVGIGTNGVSVDLAAPIGQYVGVRAGIDYVPGFTLTKSIHYDRPKVLSNVPEAIMEERYVNIPEVGAEVDVRGQLNMTQGHVLFDFYVNPTYSMHFTVGACFGSDVMAAMKVQDKTIAAVELYNKDISDGVIKPEPGYEDGIKLELEGYPLTLCKGRARFDLVVNKFRPYVGIGWGRAVPSKRISCKFDMGVMYWGSPKLVDYYGNCEISKDDTRLTQDLRDVAKLINTISVYPTLKLTVCGRLF